MRLLITTHGGAGHFHPLAPIADAAVARGHDVLFAVEPPFDEYIERAGHRAHPMGMYFDFRAPERSFPEIGERSGLEGAMWAMEHVFFGALAEAALPDVDRLIAEWQPDVVLNETGEVAGLLAAERLGIAHATFNYGGMDLSVLRYVAGTAWDRLRAAHQLPPDPDFATMADSLVIAAMPESWAGRDTSDRVKRVALPAYEGRDDPAIGGAGALPDGPLVYATFGTVNRDTDVVSSVLAALGELPFDSVVTIGDGIARDDLREVPGNVGLATYIPNSHVMPRACAVVHHGGFNTLLGALRFGLPQVMIPMDADQPLNAARAEELGFAIVLAPDRRTPSDIASAIRRVIDDRSYAEHAGRLRADIEALDPVEAAVEALAQLSPVGA
jgi:UDP:flavonoid glycosyltransferase YjiC (YdhE family)